MAAVGWAVLKFWLHCLCKWSRLSSVACAVFGQSWQWQILTTNVTPLNRVEEQTFYSKSGRKQNIFTQPPRSRGLTSHRHYILSGAEVIGSWSCCIILRFQTPAQSLSLVLSPLDKLSNACVNQGMAPVWYLAFTFIFLILFRTPFIQLSPHHVP